MTAAEFVPDVGDVGIAGRGRVPGGEHAGVEAQRPREAAAAEVAETPAITQQRIVLLQRECDERLELVDGQDDPVAAGQPLLDGVQHRGPFRPRSRWGRVTGFGKQVAAVEQQARIDVPRHAEQRAVDAVGLPDAAEVIGRLDGGRGSDARIERLERVQRDELGHPRVAELAQIGRGPARECGEELFVRRAPRQLLDIDVDAGVRTLELGHERCDDLAFAAHRPEPDDVRIVVPRAAAGDGADERGEQEPAAAGTQPAAQHGTV